MFDQIRSQHDMRVSADDNHSGDFFADQHGRIWHAEVEALTQAPAGQYTPHDPRQMPLRPPGMFMRFVRNVQARARQRLDVTQRQTYDIYIDYDAWIEQCEDGFEKWRAEMRKEAGKHPDWDRQTLLTFVGPQRGALLPAIRAAKDGNPYVLGLREADPNDPVEMRLKSLLEPPKAEKVSWFGDDPLEGIVEKPKRGRPKGSKTKRATVKVPRTTDQPEG